MAELTLSLTLTELLLAVGDFLGYGPTAVSWTSGQAAEIDRYVQAGVRQFYFPPAAEGIEAGYSWSFLKPTLTLTTTANDAAQTLPDDFGRLIGDLTYDANIHRTSVVQVSEGRLLALLQQSDDTGKPRYVAIRYIAGTTLTTGQRQEIAFWPIPDYAYVLSYRYEAYTGKLTLLLPYPLGGMRYAEVITKSCLSMAEQRANDARGVHWDQFLRSLAAAIAMDRKQGARFFGQMGGGEDVVLPRHQAAQTYPITYKGETW